MVDLGAVDILVVEDNDIDAEFTLRALNTCNVLDRTIRLRDGQDAVSYLFPPDAAAEPEMRDYPKLILMDATLPGLSGLALLKIIKNNPRTSYLPVVIFSSSVDKKVIQESYLLGVNSYIVKPVNFDHYQETVKAIGNYWLFYNQTM